MRTGLIAGAVVAAVVIGGIVVWQVRDDGDEGAGDDGGPTFVIAPVERRTLTDEVTIRGQVRRDELQRITSPIEGQVSSLLVEAGDTVEPGDTILALSGRAAVAVPGSFSFFRQLDVGSEGPDVLQLERILATDGYPVGEVDDLFTEETRAGLAEWQADRGYGGANPEGEETITVSLQGAGPGYSVGARNSVGWIVQPRAPDVVAARGAAEDDEPAELVDTRSRATRRSSRPVGPIGFASAPALPRSAPPTTEPPPTLPTPTTTTPVPAIEVLVNPVTVVEGGAANFRFRSDIPMPVDTTIDYTIGGSATAGDDYVDALTGSFVFPAGETGFNLAVTTLVDDVIESDEEIVISVGDGINVGSNDRYRRGPLTEARLIITNPPGEAPSVSVRNEQGTVFEGGAAQFVFESTQTRNEITTLRFNLSGSASEGSDYPSIEREIDLPAGGTQVTLTITTTDDQRVENDETLSVTLVGTSEYRAVGSAATVTIESNDLPELTLSGGGTIGEGDATSFSIEADQAPVVDTSVNYSVTGSATPGVDFGALTGTVVLPAGETSVEIPIATIDDDVVFRPTDMIVADWPARIGTVNVDAGEFILLGSEVLTLTEPDFTITLQLSPTDRSNLEVGLSASVELQASSQPAVAGVITELDDTATVDQAGAETYEGVIETVEPLDAVDGASVNIDVILEQRVDAITVPVAAVLQDGQGNDVVRIVLEDGRTRQVEVDVGLSEGAFVEIRSGLDGDELVLVET